MSQSIRALFADQRDGAQIAEIREVHDDALPQGDVTVQVEYSSLNYKDGMAVTGTGKIIRQFPMVPGIDLAGTVESSANPAYQPGDRVVLTGWGIGERTWGGYTQKTRVKADWLVKLPNELTTRQAMAIGTAGFTAMLCVMALEAHGLEPGGEVLVTGAAGGVGSVAVTLLAKLGYRVAASTGRPETGEYLRSLGAQEIIDRAVLSKVSPRPLESEHWAGVIDSVGGVTLANAIKTTRYGCGVAACGLAGGSELATTVLPFILRGVALLGVDSAYCRLPKRRAAWSRLVSDLPLDKLEQMSSVISLAEVPDYSRQILAGQVRGRVIVDLHK